MGPSRPACRPPGNFAMAGITAPITLPARSFTSTPCSWRPFSGACRASRRSAVYTAFSGGGNMRTLDVMASSPQALHIMRWPRVGRSYGLPVYATAATDARQPDAQAACERAVQLYALAAAGAHIIQGPTSSMDQYMLSSFAQAVIDNDIAGYVLAGLQTAEVSTDALALEVTAEVLAIPRLKDLRFSAHPHTAMHIRDEVWEPRCFDYASFAAWQRAGRPTVVERAEAVARDILSRHSVAAPPPAMVAELRRIAISQA